MSGSTVTAVVAKLPASKVKELSMMLSTDENKDKNIMLVEGPDDRKFYARFISEVHVTFNVLKSCCYMPAILDLVNKDTTLCDRVIGIKDADFDHIIGKTYGLNNLFLSDTHDWETMALTNECERNVAIEALGHNEVGIFDKVMRDLTNYSYLKLHNQEEICEKGLDGINFRNFAIHRIYDGHTACDVEVCLREIKNHNNNAKLVHFPDKKDIDTIRKKYPTPDLLQFTCGHDIIHGVVRRLTYLKGSSPEIGDKEIARQLRTSFSIELFKKTRLYSEVLAWAVSKKTVVWAA